MYFIKALALLNKINIPQLHIYSKDRNNLLRVCTCKKKIDFDKLPDVKNIKLVHGTL